MGDSVDIGVLVAAKEFVGDNGEAEIVNADGPNGYDSPAVVTEAHRCTLPPLPAVELALAE